MATILVNAFRGIVFSFILLGAAPTVAAERAVGEPTLAPPRPKAASPAGPALVPPQPAAVVDDPPPAEAPAPKGEKAAPLAPIADSKYAGPADIEATGIQGVTPGVTTREDVEKTWGAPKESRGKGNTLMQLYSVGPFPRVEVSYANNKVASIIVRFEHGFPASQVAEQLDLIKVQPVLVSNELGEVMGQAYPERGVVFSFEAAKNPAKALKKVTHIILEPIAAEPFVLRAETNLDTRPEFSLHDLNEALKLQPGTTRAHWLRSRALTALGQYEKAAEAASLAVRLEPKNARYLVTKAETLAKVGRASAAIPDAEQAVSLSQQRQHVRARALCVLGDLKSIERPADFKQAMQYHLEAIKTADALTSSPHPAVRLMAKEVLLDGHLGAVRDIAWGAWQEKDRQVEKWLAKTVLLADDLIKTEEGTDDYRFRVCTRALSAYVALQGRLDPAHWARDAVRSGENLINAAPETARKSELRWQLALALYDALQVCQMRSDHDSALKYGQLAISYMEKSNRQRQSATNTYLMGRLYFRVGAVNAIQRDDHSAAVALFEKAVPLLGKSPPAESLNDLGRLGDTFVSMGVSYWKTGHREKAIALTQHGTHLMEEAVKQGHYDQSLLAVPYKNLAAMNREMGDSEKATRMDEMAEKIKATNLR